MFQHRVLVVYSVLPQSSWSMHNPSNKQPVLWLSFGPVAFFECFHMSFLLVNHKTSTISFDNGVVYFHPERNILLALFWSRYPQVITQRVCWLGSIRQSKYWFCACVDIFDYCLLHLIVFLNPDLNCPGNFVL